MGSGHSGDPVSEGAPWGGVVMDRWHTLLPQAALPAMGVGGRTQDAGWDLVRGLGAMGAPAERPRALELGSEASWSTGLGSSRPPAFQGQLQVLGAPTGPLHTLRLFLSHHNSYVPHFPSGGPRPPEAQFGEMWARLGGGVSLLAPPSPCGALLQL